METGANKPNRSIIDSKYLESHSTKECHLSIQIGMNGISFCIRNSLEILALESYNNSLSKLESNIEKNRWLKQDYASTNITLNTKKYVLIPKLLYKNEDRNKYLKLNHINTEQLESLSDEVKSIESFVVYGISKAEQDIISTFFPKSTIKHISSIHITNMLAKYKNCEEKTMIINVDYKQIHITVLDHTKLIFFNVFNYKTAYDCVYYTLFVCEQLELNPEHLSVELMGEIKKESELYNLIYTYIRYVNFAKRSVNLSPNIDSLLEHEHYTLLHQHLCE